MNRTEIKQRWLGCQMFSSKPGRGSRQLIKHNYHICPHRSPFILVGEETQLVDSALQLAWLGFEPTSWPCSHQNLCQMHNTARLRPSINLEISQIQFLLYKAQLEMHCIWSWDSTAEFRQLHTGKYLWKSFFSVFAHICLNPERHRRTLCIHVDSGISNVARMVTFRIKLNSSVYKHLWYPLLYCIRVGLSSLGKLGGREVRPLH